MDKPETTEINYNDHGKCLRLTNGIIDIIATLDKGPRIIRYGYVDQRNQLCEYAPLSVDVDGDKWNLVGGHRLWHCPEKYPRTYIPDNTPVIYRKTKDGAVIYKPSDPWVNIDKELEISLSLDESTITLDHKLTNRNAWPVELAVWALTVMDKGGVSVVPLIDRISHFTDGVKGSNLILLWSYSRMDDSRVHWGNKYIMLTQDSNIKTNFKFGISNEDGWAAYINEGDMFIKTFQYINDAQYPDRGINYESFVNDFMLEMETLSPLKKLEPGDHIIHKETWRIIQGVTLPACETDTEKIVGNYIKSIQKRY